MIVGTIDFLVGTLERTRLRSHAGALEQSKGVLVGTHRSYVVSSCGSIDVNTSSSKYYMELVVLVSYLSLIRWYEFTVIHQSLIALV